MKKHIASVLLALVFVILIQTSQAFAVEFEDVPSTSWYMEAADYVSNHGIMTGLTPQTFGPKEPLTRNMTVTILHRMADNPAAAVATFSDWKKGKWWSEAVSWAQNCGGTIITGYTADNTFRGGNNINRQDFILIIYRFCKFMDYDFSSNLEDIDITLKSDYSFVSGYAKESMTWGYRLGFIGNGSDLKPKSEIKRNEAAMIFMRLCRMIDEKENKEPHTHSYACTTRPAGCEAAGEHTYTCECGDRYTEVIPATGHTIVIDPAIEATCITEGKTEGSHCSVCERILVVQNTIPISEHTILEEIVQEATCEVSGEKRSVCSNCGHVEKTETIPAVGHNLETTTNSDGSTVTKCTVCGTVTATTPATTPSGNTYINGDGKVTKMGHQAGCTGRLIQYYLYKENTDTADGILVIYCQNCYGCCNVVRLPSKNSAEWQGLLTEQNRQLATLNNIRSSAGLPAVVTTTKGTICAYVASKTDGRRDYGNYYCPGQVAYGNSAITSASHKNFKYFSSDGQTFHLADSNDFSEIQGASYVKDWAFNFDTLDELNANLVINVKWENYIGLTGASK